MSQKILSRFRSRFNLKRNSSSCYGETTLLSNTYEDRALIVQKKCSYLPLRQQLTLKSGKVTEIEISSFKNSFEIAEAFHLMNAVIAEGRTWPFMDTYESIDSYSKYFHSHASFAVRFTNQNENGSEILGCFYIKPNFPGRCSHICNGGFITSPKYRNLGIGKLMGSAFIQLAKDLGYQSSLFNLVFANNLPSIKLWKSLGFRELACIPKAAKLEGERKLIDAIQFYMNLNSYVMISHTNLNPTTVTPPELQSRKAQVDSKVLQESQQTKAVRIHDGKTVAVAATSGSRPMDYESEVRRLTRLCAQQVPHGCSSLHSFIPHSTCLLTARLSKSLLKRILSSHCAQGVNIFLVAIDRLDGATTRLYIY
jgi:RimJ/RimL family protein N-acetyltransferase